MERWTLRRPFWYRFIATLPALLMSGGTAGISIFIGFGLIVSYFKDGFGISSLISGVLILPFGGYIFKIFMDILIDLSQQVFFDQNGIGYSIFGRQIFFFLWKDVVESGIATGSWTRRDGPSAFLYFSNKRLSEAERVVIDEACGGMELKRQVWIPFCEISKDHNVMWVHCTRLRNIEQLERVCPVSIPYEYQKKGSKYKKGLSQEWVSFYRQKQPDGSWGEEDMDKIFFLEHSPREYIRELRKNNKRVSGQNVLVASPNRKGIRRSDEGSIPKIV